MEGVTNLMAWIFYRGKKRKILDVLDNSSLPKHIKNTTLYVEGDTKNSMYKVSAIRSKNVLETKSVKKYNDKVFKARDYFIKQNNNNNERKY